MPASAVHIAVRVTDAAWRKALPGAVALARCAARAAVVGAGAPVTGGELVLVLADDALVQVLNRDYRGKDKPTNVLSFPLDARAGLLGDVLLARQTLFAEALAAGKAPADHLTHLVVHGTLHLLGYDHEKRGEARRMEALETEILAGLGIADPYRPPVRRRSGRAA